MKSEMQREQEQEVTSHDIITAETRHDSERQFDYSHTVLLGWLMSVELAALNCQ